MIGLAGCAVLIWQTNPDSEDWDRLLTPSLPLMIAGLVLLWGIIYLLHSITYKTIIGEDAGKIKPIRLYGICVAGFALNEVTPLGLVGGEPFRIMALKKAIGTHKATSATLTFSVLYAAGHILLWITGVIIYLVIGCPGETFTTVVLIVTLLLMTAACYVFFNHKNSGIILPVLRRLAKLPLIKKPVGKLLADKKEVLHEVDSGYVTFRSDKDRFKNAIVCEYCARLLEGVEYFLILRYLGVKVSVFGGILILGMASLIGNLLFFVPMQAGTRESGMALAIDWLNIDPAIGAISGLLYRMRYIACILIGVICILVIKDSTKAETGE